MKEGFSGTGELFGSIAGTGALGPFSPADPSAPPEEQAKDVFRAMSAALAAAGLGWKDVVRTWFYLDGIYSWYPVFNRVRTEFFAANGIVRLPASTGIGLKAGEGALTAAFLAAPGGWNSVESPLQVPATDYKSSFSRAAEADGVLYVSGTAAILPGSHEVAFPCDAAAQTRCTLDAVEAILRSRGTRWEKVSRAVAYVKRPEDAAASRQAVLARGLPEDKMLFLVADVCRDGWLFEIEVDAAL